MATGTYSSQVVGPPGAVGAEGANAIPAGQALAVDAKTATATVMLAAQAAKFFVPAGTAYARVRALTGVLAVAPILRIGNNGTHDNLCALATLTGAVVGQVFTIPLIITPLALDIGTNPISVEIQTPATATTMTIDVFFDGVVL